MSDRPLTNAEIRARNYEPTSWGWHPIRPATKLAPVPGSCRFCQEYLPMDDHDACAGCAYFGLGDPHGRRVQKRETSSSPMQRSHAVTFPQSDLDDGLRRAVKEVLGDD